MKISKRISGHKFTRLLVATAIVGGLLMMSFSFLPPNGSTPQAVARTTSGALGNPGSAPVYFEENQGQFDKRVRYFARGTNGYGLFLTATDAVYVLSSYAPVDERAASKNPKSEIRNPTSSVAVYMSLAGANPNSDFGGTATLQHQTNYFKGRQSNWRTGISNYGEVRMNDVYAGVDMVWHGKQSGGAQYDFVVKPDADASQIAWRVTGADKVELTADGDLLITTAAGEIRQSKPFTYQESEGLRAEVESGFIVEKTENAATVRFNVGAYDRSKPLTIDPSVNLSNLAFSTFLGGESFDDGNAVAVDGAGNVYVTGQTSSILFPTTAGTIDPSFNGDSDVFVAKFNAGGNSLVYSTFIGGSQSDLGISIAVDSSGNAIVAGETHFIDFPTTPGVFDNTYNFGGGDAFLLKLNSSGSSLVYSTYLGGSGFDTSNGVAIDSAGNAYVAGSTTSADFPTPIGYDSSFGGGGDAFVSKFNPGGSALVYSTYLGGSLQDAAFGLTVDSAGSAFVTGATISPNFPTTPGAYDNSFNSVPLVSDAFITKLNAGGSALIYSTFIGGGGIEQGNDIAIDAAGNAYVTGFTDSSDYPVTAGTFDTSPNGLNDVMVTKLNAAGSALVFSTFIGGSSDDYGRGIALDSSGFTYITGYSNDGVTDYPTTPAAYDQTNNGFEDSFVTRLNLNGSSLLYSTLIGGNSIDFANGIAIDSVGNVYIAGQTSSDNLPTTPEAFQPQNNGNLSVFVTKFGDYSISGQTVDTTGAPLANTAIGLSGDGDGFLLTDGRGYFTFPDTLSGGTYLVSAMQTLYNFNPPNYEIANLNRNKRVTFVGRPTSSGPTSAYANLGGDVKSTAGNVGLPFTTLTLVDTARGDVRTATTDAEGNYRFADVRTGAFYIVFARREGYNFAPGNAAVTFLNENLDVNFSAAPNSPRPVEDFDGDGKTDLAVYRPSEGNWYILQSQNNAVKVVRFGANGDIPVAEDYDGDRRADLAVFRPSDGNWYRLNSSDGAFSAVHFGLSEDRPVAADYDGDGRTDIAVFRPSTGVWHRLNSSNGSYAAIQWGIATDRPVAADFDADGKADLTVYRDGTWYRLNSSNNQAVIYQFGLGEDVPIAADFSGDGRPDTAVFRPSSGVWYWTDNISGDFHAVQFGLGTDIPVAADYNGDGRMEEAVYRAGTWFVLRSDLSFYANRFGTGTDVPIPAAKTR